jgi:predicted nucleic acid-binding protein
MGREKYLIDTNVAIYYFGQLLAKNSETFIEDLFKNKYSISVINRIELLGNKNLEQQEQNALESFVNSAFVYNFDEEIILKTIGIRKKYPIKLPDAIIAATCIVNNCTLITNNLKDFKKIEGVKTLQVNLITF